VAGFCDLVTPDPIYVDYGMTVVYEGETVYVDNKPIPAAEYSAPMIAMATEVAQPPPPTPPRVDEAAGKAMEPMYPSTDDVRVPHLGLVPAPRAGRPHGLTRPFRPARHDLPPGRSFSFP
jgi:hypothetical protein